MPRTLKPAKRAATVADQQLPLELPSQPALGRADFLQAPSNTVALNALEAAEGLPGGLLVLVGPAGSGKSHLANIWCERTGARRIAPQDLAQAAPDLLLDDTRPPLVIDPAQPVAASAGEEALFHLINHYRGHGQILLCARVPVRDWGIVLPDLGTRLNAAAHVTLSQPDETLLAAVLVKLFSDRQLLVQPPLIDYLLSRMERSLAAARDLVARLDARALQLRRPITRSLAREVMDLDAAEDAFENAAGQEHTGDDCA